MAKRYQVFISSTCEDLREERQEVIQALLELECIPAGIELFPAADDESWTLIKNFITECDYYVLIVGEDTDREARAARGRRASHQCDRRWRLL